jgi:oligopeptide/dipeptide ABC transporter ATP-binding protein
MPSIRERRSNDATFRPEAMSDPVLTVRDLSVSFRQEGAVTQAVKRVSFDVGRGETVAIVGESGSGKSVTALSTVELLPGAARVQGSAVFEGQEMVGATEKRLRQIRGNSISFIFQEPMTSLNPLHTIEKQLGESLSLHQGIAGAKARTRIVELLTDVGINDPESRLGAYPHQLSGGQRQRVMIAMALANRPSLLIADEPTTALDVTIQAQILDLLRRLKAEFGMAIVLITHDLGVIAEMADRVLVMYAGRVVEEAPVRALFRNPAHPYTEGLLASIPDLERDQSELRVIEGMVPSPFAMPRGCRFHPRCAYAREPCREREPPSVAVAPGHRAACIRHTGYRHEPAAPQAAVPA